MFPRMWTWCSNRSSQRKWRQRQIFLKSRWLSLLFPELSAVTVGVCVQHLSPAHYNNPRGFSHSSSSHIWYFCQTLLDWSHIEPHSQNSCSPKLWLMSGLIPWGQSEERSIVFSTRNDVSVQHLFLQINSSLSLSEDLQMSNPLKLTMTGWLAAIWNKLYE